MNRKQKRIRLKNLIKQQKQSRLRKRTKVVSFLDNLNKIFKYGDLEDTCIEEVSNG